ncbi:hypothetical protein [Chromobacterium sp. CV08]|uniref:hypothetical protein n=1 Tax=Chromobacterium sp. CV08 TaxID=3133274 RepID=UPI003DA96EA1
MTPIPHPVKNVRIYPYIPDASAIVPPVFIDGIGTYSYGTMLMYESCYLELASGKAENGGVSAGIKYYAVYPDHSGKDFTTDWMNCTQGGAQPQFSRTVRLGPGGGQMAGQQAE